MAAWAMKPVSAARSGPPPVASMASASESRCRTRNSPSRTAAAFRIQAPSSTPEPREVASTGSMPVSAAVRTATGVLTPTPQTAPISRSAPASTSASATRRPVVEGSLRLLPASSHRRCRCGWAGRRRRRGPGPPRTGSVMPDIDDGDADARRCRQRRRQSPAGRQIGCTPGGLAGQRGGDVELGDAVICRHDHQLGPPRGQRAVGVAGCRRQQVDHGAPDPERADRQRLPQVRRPAAASVSRAGTAGRSSGMCTPWWSTLITRRRALIGQQLLRCGPVDAV